MRECRLIAQDPQIDITIPMGDGPAIITGGLGGWQPVEVLDDIAATAWTGQSLLTMDVPLLLDGFGTNDSVERAWNTIRKLGRDPNGTENVPPVFRVFGPFDYGEGKAWVLPESGIEPDTESVIRRDDGTLLRQAFTLHLLEYRRPNTLRKRKKKRKSSTAASRDGGTTFPGTRYVTKQGDTLQKIAAALFGDWKQWKAIGDLNHLSDPNKVLPVGETLKLP